MENFFDVITKQKEGKELNLWSGTMIDYLYKVKENPEIATFAPGRIYNMIMKHGTKPVNTSLKTKGYDDLVSYNFFNEKIYGTLEAIHDLMRFLKASARRTETGKRIFIMVGPVASGKSSIASLIKKGLEMDNTPKFTITGCPLHEEPLHLIPDIDRSFWEDKLKVRIEGTLCPVCQRMIDVEYTNKEGIIAWENVPVESFIFSEQKRKGIGTFQPSDPKCVKWDTYLFSNEGMLTFEELQETAQSDNDEFVPLEIGISGTNGNELTSHFYNNGIQEIINIKTKLGYDISATPVHPLLTMIDGKLEWKETKDIEIEDVVVLQRRQKLFGNKIDLPEFVYNGPESRGKNKNITFPSILTPKLSKLLGYMVSEGSIGEKAYYFGNKNMDIINDFNQCFKETFSIDTYNYNRGNDYISVCNWSSKLSSWLLNVCGIKKGAYNKDIPKIIRTSTKENILSFLEGLFWGDGTISSRHTLKSNRFKYDSASITLAKQVQMMLMNFGIVSALKKKIIDKKFTCYSVIVTGDDVLDVLELIPSLKNKKTDDGEFISKRYHSNWDSVPNIQPLFSDIFGKIKDVHGPIYKIKDLIKFERYKSYSDSWSRNPRKSTVLEFVDVASKFIGFDESLETLKSYADGNLIFLKVENIELQEPDQVYDLTVPGTHSFCANGFVNHNSQDITELIGRVNMTKSARWGETDPRAFEFNGEMHVANGGLVEYVEILKADTKFLYVLISAAQEQVIKSPGFPQVYVDEVILSHTNQSEFDKFKSNKDNEAIHDRMYKCKVPYNLRVDDEIKIYEKMIRESDFKGIHIAPHTLKIAAQFAILTRLTASPRVTSLIEKMKLYNGEMTESFKKQEMDIKSLIEEGRKNGEGMFGISPRFVINALNVAFASKEDKNCINPIDTIRSLKQNFDHHIGISEEDITSAINMLEGDKDSVAKEFKEIAKKEVNMAFLYAYEDQAQALFSRYMINADAFCRKDRIIDSITGEDGPPDEKLMRSIEERIQVPENSKEMFRREIFVHESSVLRNGGTFDYKSYDPIRDAIEKKLMKDLKNVVSLSIGDTTTTNPKAQEKRNGALNTLINDKGYCKHCANILLTFIGEVLRREG